MRRYQVIYADPPWAYRNKKTGGSMVSGSDAKYNVMSIDEIAKLPVSDIADKASALFLWTTTPMLQDAFYIMNEWGYKYKTAIYWRKIMSLGMGFWYRGQVEVCLLGIRGKVKAFRIQKANFIQTKAFRHSEKPQEMRDLIEMTGLQPRIELFARQKVEGWTSLGLEISGKTIQEELANLINS